MDPPLLYVLPAFIWRLFDLIVHPSDGGQRKSLLVSNVGIGEV